VQAMLVCATMFAAKSDVDHHNNPSMHDIRPMLRCTHLAETSRSSVKGEIQSELLASQSHPWPSLMET